MVDHPKNKTPMLIPLQIYDSPEFTFGLSLKGNNRALKYGRRSMSVETQRFNQRRPN
jgi:hypothetical protein